MEIIVCVLIPNLLFGHLCVSIGDLEAPTRESEHACLVDVHPITTSVSNNSFVRRGL